MTTTINMANPNTIWASVLVEALVRSGVTHFVISPGSRSTPLAIAAVEHPKTTTTVHFDERGAGYFALGYARANQCAAALICTSGTAVANYLPAIVEASQDFLPMVVLTADRPPETWNSGVNQTILQDGIYSHYTRLDRTLSVPGTHIPLAFLIEMVDRACDAMQNVENPGPVHLNCPFEKPLEPTGVTTDFAPWLLPIRSWLNNDVSLSQNTNRPVTDIDPLIVVQTAARLARATHGLLVFGRENDRKHAESYLKLARILKWPIWIDIQSPLRSSLTYSELSLLNADILSHSDLQNRWQPNVILQFGGPLTSQLALDYFTEVRPDIYLQVHPRSPAMDPTKCVTHPIQTEGGKFAEALYQRLSDSEIAPSYFDSGWSTQTQNFQNQYFGDVKNDLFEAHLAHIISQKISRDCVLFLGNSMPIRDFDRFARLPANCQVYANRGASGIDGNIATMAGLAEGMHRPVMGVIGDLAALHDLNSLHLVRQSQYPIVLVIINNHGGGIFSHLPIAQHSAVFEPYFETPHPYDFESAAKQFGLERRLVTKLADTENLPEWLSSKSSLIIEIQTERSIQADFRRQLTARIHQLLSGNFQ